MKLSKETRLERIFRRFWLACLITICCAPRLVSGEISTVRFQADWFTNGQFAGFIAAEKRAYYETAGLEFKFEPFNFGVDFIGRVASGEAQFGTAESYIILDALARGEELVLLGAVFDTSPAGYIYLQKSGIRSPRDLRGKRIGIHNYSEKLIPFFLDQAHIRSDEVEVVTVQHRIESLLEGAVDLHQGYAIDEMLNLQRLTEEPVGILTFEELGLPMYSMILFTSRRFAEEHPDRVKRFLSATQKGWRYAFQNPKTTAGFIKQATSSTEQTEAELSMQIRSMRPFAAPSEAILSLEGDQLKRMLKVFHQNGLTELEIRAERIVDAGLTLLR